MEWISGANEALLNEATGFQGNYSSGLSSPPFSSFWSLQLLLQDGRLLDLTRNDGMGSSGKQVVGRAEEIKGEEVNKALEGRSSALRLFLASLLSLVVFWDCQC